MGAKRIFPQSGRFSENSTRLLRAAWFCGLLLCIAIAGAHPAHAQSTRSALAGIDLPAGARDWSGDDDGSKQATLDLGASLAGVACAVREARSWAATSVAVADEVATRTNTALLAAGWTLEPLSRTPDGQRILQARRANDRLVMLWQPGEGEVGLLLCRAEGATAEVPSLPEAAPAEPPPSAIGEVPTVPENAAPRASRIDDAFGAPPIIAQVAPPSGEVSSPAPSVELPPEATPPVAEEAADPPPQEESLPPPAVAEPVPEAAKPTGDDFGLPALIVAILALVAGGVALIVRELQARRLDTAWQWPTATTTIERGWIEEEEDLDRRGAPVTTYLPVLKYRYAVDGEDHEGSQIGLDDAPLPTADAARARLAKYSDFTTVEIRYDPEDPAFAVIEAPRPKPGLDFYFGIGAIVIALVVLLSHFF